MRIVRAHRAVLSIALCLMFFSSQARTISTAPTNDYTLQTLYIFNFTKYVEWPSANKSMKIGVVDNAAAEEYLAKMARAKSTGGTELIVINTKNESELGSCQIIFIPSNNTHLAAKLIERFSSESILIVTEEPDLTKKGASVSFKLVSGKLRFQINEEAIKSRGMKVSSSLVTLAEK